MYRVAIRGARWVRTEPFSHLLILRHLNGVAPRFTASFKGVIGSSTEMKREIVEPIRGLDVIGARMVWLWTAGRRQ